MLKALSCVIRCVAVADTADVGAVLATFSGGAAGTESCSYVVLQLLLDVPWLQ